MSADALPFSIHTLIERGRTAILNTYLIEFRLPEDITRKYFIFIHHTENSYFA